MENPRSADDQMIYTGSGDAENIGRRSGADPNVANVKGKMTSRSESESNGKVPKGTMVQYNDNGLPHKSATGYVKCVDVVEIFGMDSDDLKIAKELEATRTASRREENRMECKESQECGCGCCAPKCLQPLAVPLSYLVCISCVVFTQSCVVSGYSSGILTTIEKRYDLWTRELGYIISSYDIAAMCCGLIVSYTGERFNRAGLVGKGAFVIAIGSVLFSLPHFIGGKYTYSLSSDDSKENPNICNSTLMSSLESDSSCDEADKNPEEWALAIFMVAFMIIGVGSSPIYSIGATYLYDNVSAAKFPVYSSIMYAFGALGPAVGFLVAAACTEVWVHPESDPPVGLTTGDTGWVGAWWIGLLAIALIAILVGSSLLLFPRSLPNIERSIHDEDAPTFAGFGSHIKEFPKVLWKLICNPTWLFISLVMVVEQSIGTLFNRYIGKYFQSVFNMTVFYASILMGAVLIPAAVLGIICGGVLMKKLNLSISGICRFLLILSFIPAIAISILIAYDCDGLSFAGVTKPYSVPNYTESSMQWKENLTSTCNSHCLCQGALYEPICGPDDVTYFSPCHAGCATVAYITDEGGTTSKNFTDCSCIQDSFPQMAAQGRCDAGCGSIIPVLIILFIVVFCTTLGQNPVLLVTLRCVDPNARSFALGMQNLLIQLLAYIPTPIYFGQIFDSTCMLWSSTCHGEGACLEYKTTELPLYLYGTCLGFKGITMILLILVYIAAKRKEDNSYDLSKVSNDTDITISTVVYDESSGETSTVT